MEGTSLVNLIRECVDLSQKQGHTLDHTWRQVSDCFKTTDGICADSTIEALEELRDNLEKNVV